MKKNHIVRLLYHSSSPPLPHPLHDPVVPSEDPPAATLQNGPSEEAEAEAPTAEGDAETAAAIQQEVDNQTADGEFLPPSHHRPAIAVFTMCHEFH